MVESTDLTVAAGVWNRVEPFLAVELFEPLNSQSGGVLSCVRGVRDFTVDRATVRVWRQSPNPPRPSQSFRCRSRMVREIFRQ